MQVYRSCFDNITYSEDLKALVYDITPLRVKFLQELRGSISELEDYLNTTTEGFCLTNDYSYMLGKCLNLEGNDKSLLVFYISELYVEPEYRNKGVAKALLQDICLQATMQNKAVVLGCAEELTKFYEDNGFESIPYPQPMPKVQMMASGNEQKIKTLCEILS